MFWLRTAIVTILAAGLVIVVAVVLALVPLWTGPAMPAGATRLQIATASPGLTFGCPAALLLPVRVASRSDALIVVSVESGDLVRVIWPGGFAAWRADGRAVLAGPYGNVIGGEGDVLDDLGGGVGADGAFQVCALGAGFDGLAERAPWYLLAMSAALGVVLVGVPWALARRRRRRDAASGAMGMLG
jgi:hypothetical protein